MKKRRMKKCLSWLLTLCLVAALTPAMTLTASAAEGVLMIGDVDVSAGGYWINDGSGGITKTGATEKNYNVYYDAASNTLTLNEAQITENYAYGNAQEDPITASAAVFYSGAEDLKVTLAGNNTLTGENLSSEEGSYSSGIYASEGSLIFSGTGTLTATGGNATTSIGIESTAVKIAGGTVKAVGGQGEEASCGIAGYESVEISGGNVTAGCKDVAQGYMGVGILGDDIKITGGTVASTGGNQYTESFGIMGASAVEISGGIVTAIGGTVDKENLDTMSAGIFVRGADENTLGDIKITGGEITAKTAVTDEEASQFFAVGARGSLTVGSEAKIASIANATGWELDAESSSAFIEVGAISVGKGDLAPVIMLSQSDTANPVFIAFDAIKTVSVTPASVSVEQGKTQQFTAEVTGTGNFDKTVTWSVSGNNSADTKIDSKGLLTVGSDETAALLTVKAVAVGDQTKTASASVTVTEKAVTGTEKTEVSVESFTADDITEDLKLAGFDTVEKIITALKIEMNKVSGSVDNSAVYDLVLKYYDGDKWIKADKEHFPADGKLLVTMQVPEGSDPLKHDYTVIHMFSQNWFGKTAGEFENPDVTVGKGSDGKYYLQFYVTGVSPIMVKWSDKAGVSADTGDDANSMLYVGVMVVSLAGAAAAAFARRRRSN